MTKKNDDDAPDAPPVLRGDDAVALWQQGRDAWNDWIAAHPGAEIDFGGVDFTPHRTKGEKLSFTGFHFGDGYVDFEDATFGDGDVYFINTEFGDSIVDFKGAAFGDGGVFFWGATFGDGIVDFSDASVDRLTFDPRTFESRSLDCSSLIVKSAAHFDLSVATDKLAHVSFRNAVFVGPFTLDGVLSAPPDLRGTKADHHVDLSDLRASLRRQPPKRAWPPILSRTVPDHKNAVADAARFRRLKELAEANRDHAAALRFAAYENRAKRWHETGWFASVLDMAFSGFSDYGQSIWRPAAGLVVLTAIAAVLYRAVTDWGCWADAISLAAGNAVAFLPQSRAVRADAVDALFGPDPGTWIDLAILAQAALSFVFLFLIGLGLRNRFRL